MHKKHLALSQATRAGTLSGHDIKCSGPSASEHEGTVIFLVVALTAPFPHLQVLHKLCHASTEEDIKVSAPVTSQWEDPQGRSLTITCTHLFKMAPIPLGTLYRVLFPPPFDCCFLLWGAPALYAPTMQWPSPTRWLGSEAQYRQQGMRGAFCQSPLCSWNYSLAP